MSGEQGNLFPICVCGLAFYTVEWKMDRFDVALIALTAIIIIAISLLSYAIG